MAESSSENSLHREYRLMVEEDLLGDSIRSAMLLFFVLQTFVFIPADWILFPDRFNEFLVARLAENVLLAFLYFKWSYISALQSTAISSLTGAALFLFMVHVTGGVESGYYVGLILLLVGIAVLTPLSGTQGSLIAGTIFLAYAVLPWTSHAGEPVNWSVYAQHLFFLGSSCVEAGLACLLMDRMRFNDFQQRRELTRARDELAELDKAKSRFSANVHHELRTPLTLILSPLDALRGGEFGEVSPGVSKVLDTMHSNGRRLHRMINNLLDLSKVENDQFQIVRRPTRLDRLVKELVTGAQPMAARKNVSMTTRGFDDPIEIAIDVDAIEKVIVNLLGNALKFTESGGAIDVIGRPSDEGILISICDTGIGIPSNQIESIFDRFAQVDTSATRNYEGTGIGLSLADEMVRHHDGRIWAESEGEGAGSTFHVWLPSGEADHSVEDDVLATDSGRLLGARESISSIEADLGLERVEDSLGGNLLDDLEQHASRYADRNNGSDRPRPATEAESSQGLVVIAEDNPDMRRLLVSLVGRHYAVRAARNGRDALSLVHEEKPDLVLSDVMMPEMDGVDLCREIKGNAETASIPVVLVTSKAESEMKLEGLELGANDYVTKPFHPRELLARIGSLIRSSVLQRELSDKNDQLASALEELQRAEVQLVKRERLAAVGELAAGIAHEVNNPLNFALNGARALSRIAADVAEILKVRSGSTETGANRTEYSSDYLTPATDREVDALSNEILELSEIVAEGLERTHRLVADLRNFASSESQERARSPVDMSACINLALNLMGPTFTALRIETNFTCSGTPREISGDSASLGQVFLNLLKNSCDALSESGGQIHVNLVYSATHAEVRFSDNGHGIPESNRDRVFDPFFSTKLAGEGTGLGLAISRQIIEDHNGTILFCDGPTGGSEFLVKIPFSGYPSP